MSILVTPSLFNSIKWYKECPPNYESDAERQLDEMLNRTSKWEPSDAVQRGINFENTIYNVLRSNSVKRGSEHFNNVLELCRNGVFQKTSKAIITHNDQEYCLYGKLDVWFHDHIIDIKTTNEGKPIDHYIQKYLTTMQHHLYCYTENIKDFIYVVVLFDKQNRITNVLEVKYESVFCDEETYIKSQIDELNKFFALRPQWLEAWHTKFSLYN